MKQLFGDLTLKSIRKPRVDLSPTPPSGGFTEAHKQDHCNQSNIFLHLNSLVFIIEILQTDFSSLSVCSPKLVKK